MKILAIESAVAEGSIAIIHDDERAVLQTGNGASRAERILQIIANLLEQAGLSMDELDLIAVSSGPGSYSGIRIGMSTALGLRDSLDIRSIGVPLLTAMSSAAIGDGSVICAVPIGKNDVAWQLFGTATLGKRGAAAEPCLSSLSSFAKVLVGGPSTGVLFAPGEILERVKDAIPDNVTCVDAGKGLAEYVGRFAMVNIGTDDSMRPVYLRNQDGPSRSF